MQLKSLKVLFLSHLCLQFLTKHRWNTCVSGLQAPPSNVPSSGGGWRVALNIYRVPYTTMPKSWASSGARFPLVMKCNFTDDGMVDPISGDVRYTVAEGEVIKPVQAGPWTLSNNRNLKFSFLFPEQMERNGVELLGPCEIVCEGLLYSKKDLDALDQDFYQARSVTDQVNAEVKAVKGRNEAPKKWNFKTNRWEKRYPNQSVVSSVGNRLKQWTAGIAEESQNRKRPKPLELSLESGEFPGIDCNVYIKKDGLIKLKVFGLDRVIGSWSAEPLNDNPASYYRPSY